MSREVSTKQASKNARTKVGASKQARPVRKATFMAHPSHKGEFTPVNARASKHARSMGKRTRVTRADLKAIAATGKVKVYAWVTTQTGQLVLRKVAA